MEAAVIGGAIFAVLGILLAIYDHYARKKQNLSGQK